jgi:hypothetical protein
VPARALRNIYNIYGIYSIYITTCVDLILKDSLNKKIEKSLITPQEVLDIDFLIRSKAAEWGEEDDHVQYLLEIAKK